MHTNKDTHAGALRTRVADVTPSVGGDSQSGGSDAERDYAERSRGMFARLRVEEAAEQEAERQWYARLDEELDGAAASRETYPEWLARLSGVPQHEFSPAGVGIVSKSAALQDGEAGRRVLAMFELVGDMYLSAALARRSLVRDMSAEQFHAARVACTAVRALTGLYAAKFPPGYVSFPSDVDPSVGSAGSKAVKAALGLVGFELGVGALSTFCSAVGVYSLYDGWP